MDNWGNSCQNCTGITHRTGFINFALALRFRRYISFHCIFYSVNQYCRKHPSHLNCNLTSYTDSLYHIQTVGLHYTCYGNQYSDPNWWWLEVAIDKQEVNHAGWLNCLTLEKINYAWHLKDTGIWNSKLRLANIRYGFAKVTCLLMFYEA